MPDHPWPTRIDRHGAEVIDGSRLPDGAELQVRLGPSGVWHSFHVPGSELDGEDPDIVEEIARQMAIDLLETHINA